MVMLHGWNGCILKEWKSNNLCTERERERERERSDMHEVMHIGIKPHLLNRGHESPCAVLLKNDL